jgi:anthraniloyl-CoA monooxygenase
LIGDAAHSAQFSIGSGTKIAMEDAIALAASFEASDSVAGAIAHYEEMRMDEVARLQRTAMVSLQWYENARRYNAFDAPQYVFNYITRSKSITYENLGLRDPAYMEGVNRWFARIVSAEQSADIPDDNPPPPMFTPFRLRSMTLQNRVVVSPMCQYSAIDGMPADWHLVHLGGLAVGGAGLVFTEMTNVSADGRITPGCAGMYDPEHADAWRRIVDFVHANSRAKICMQLAHAGRKGSTKRPWEGEPDEPLEEGAWQTIAASPIPFRSGGPPPREMDRADMDRVRDDFVRAAAWANEAGFDMIELHMAHGYLLSSFISPLSNKRDDDYGGDIPARMKFPLEVLDAVRAHWPDDKPLSVRVSATDWVEDGGLTGDDAVEVARLLVEHGCDIIDVSAGQTTEDAEPIYGRMFQTPFSDQIRQEAGVPTITVGNITSADQVNTIIASGRADLCALARPHLSDPHFTLRAAAHYGYEPQYWPEQYLAGKAQSAVLATQERQKETELLLAARPPSHQPADE